jgi:hypothetical protein
MAEDLCRECGRPYCSECLVYAFGPKKPPLCLSCAIAAAGVRKHAGRSRAMSKRELKQRSRERRRVRRAKAEKAEKAKRAPVGAEAVDVKPLDIAAALDDDGPMVRQIDDAGDWSEPFESGAISSRG